jgi:N-acetylglucosaminyl-diphospho-decaprenol L-rhamnosyltransferase
VTNKAEERRGTLPVSAVIVSYNAGEDLSRCVASLLNQECAVEIVVVDNGSRDGSIERAQNAFPTIQVLPGARNDGFAGGANRGAAAASGQTLLFLNPDVVLEPGCADALIIALGEAQGNLLCAPLIIDASGQRVEYGFTIDCVGDLVALSSPGKPLYLSGCALATSRELFDALGGFDSEFFMFCEDLDFCWRALLHGGQVRVVPSARVRHRGGGSTPGGYLGRGRIEVTAFRIALRERNTLAALVRCGPVGWVALVIALRVARIGAIALVAVASGRFDLAHALAKGIAWNVHRLPELVRQRRSMRASPKLRRRVLRERMLRDLSQLRALLRHGLPRFVDNKGQV